MAKDRSTTAETHTSKSTTSERTAYRAGDKVEYDGQLAKVVTFGFLELPTLPGQDMAISDKLVAHLQLPADVPGGKPNYAFFVPPNEMTPLRDDPKRQRSLEMKFNALFGDLVPPSDEVLYKEPNMKGVTSEGREPSKDSGKARSGAQGVEGITSRSGRAAINMPRATGAIDVEGTSGTAKTVSTKESPRSAEAKAAKRSAKKPAKASKKSAKKARR